MIPIHYQVVGEEDYAFVINIDHDGNFHIDSGSYTTEPPREGKLTPAQQSELIEAVHSLGIPQPHDMPEGAADAFRAQLRIGEGADAVTYPFWEGALEEDSALEQLIRLLEQL